MKKHKNLVEGLRIERPEQVWVSDITYIPTSNGHSYLSLVTGAYSKKIMGYHLAADLRAEGPVEALRMAIGKKEVRLWADPPFRQGIANDSAKKRRPEKLPMEVICKELKLCLTRVEKVFLVVA